MDNYTLWVFSRLSAAGTPTADEREQIYAFCREEVAVAWPDEAQRSKALAELEKVIRRQEMQALYEESLGEK
jgi:hypothetical protein